METIRQLSVIYFKCCIIEIIINYKYLFYCSLDEFNSSNEYYKIGLLRPISPLQSPKFTSSPINHHNSSTMYKVCIIFFFNIIILKRPST